jgi:hypothetical protein
MVRVRLPRRNFCVRLRHNPLSALEVFKIRKYRRKFPRPSRDMQQPAAAAAVILQACSKLREQDMYELF